MRLILRTQTHNKTIATSLGKSISPEIALRISQLVNIKQDATDLPNPVFFCLDHKVTYLLIYKGLFWGCVFFQIHFPICVYETDNYLVVSYAGTQLATGESKGMDCYCLT